MIFFHLFFRNFRWYRKIRRGKWGKVTGFFWGKNWHHLPTLSAQWDEFWVDVYGQYVDCFPPSSEVDYWKSDGSVGKFMLRKFEGRRG